MSNIGWYSEKLYIAKAFKSMANSIYTDMNAQRFLVGMLDDVKRAVELVCIQANGYHSILLECAETCEKRVLVSGGFRVATKEDLNKNGYDLKTTVYNSYTCNLKDKENVKHIAMLQWMINGDIEAFARAGYSPIKKSMGFQLEEAKEGVRDAVKYVLSGGFDSDLADIKAGKDKFVAYEEHSDVKAYSLVKLIAELERLIGVYGCSKEHHKIADKILKDYKKKKNFNLSYKQIAILRYTYLDLCRFDGVEKQMEFAESSIKIEGISTEDNDIINKMWDNEDKLACKDTEFAYKVLRSVIRYKKCSEKQMNVIRESFDKVKLLLDEQVATVDTSAVFSDEVFNPYEDENTSTSSDVFDNSDNRFRNKNYEVSESAPKLTDIYDELGFGGSKDGILGI